MRVLTRVTGEFNEAIADCDAARRIEPGDKAIAALKAKAEEERVSATWAFSIDMKVLAS